MNTRLALLVVAFAAREAFAEVVPVEEGKTVYASASAFRELVKNGRGTLVTTGDFTGKAALEVGTWRIAGGSKVVVDGSPIDETTWFYVKGERDSLVNPAGGAFLEVTEGSSLTVKGVSYVGIGDRYFGGTNRTRGYGSLVVTDGAYLDLSPSAQVRVTDYGSVGGYGVIAVSNSAATIRKELRLAPTARDDNFARFIVSHSTVTNAGITVNGPATNGAWFDAATLVPIEASENWLTTGEGGGAGRSALPVAYYHIQSGGLAVDTDVDVTIPAAITGEGGLVKLGRGMLTLAGDNTYAGDTVVKAGTLAVTGSIAGRLVLDGGKLTLTPGGRIAAAQGYGDDTQVRIAGMERLTEGAVVVRSDDADFLTWMQRMLLPRVASDLDLKIADDALTLVASASGDEAVGGVVARVPLTDGRTTWTNPGCGIAGGGWTTLKKDGYTEVKLTAPNQTKLWSLQQFSKGYYYKNDQHYQYAKKYCGGADIPLNDTALKSIADAFESCRAAGGTVIPRFAYTWDGWGGCEPDDFEMMLTHIRQLAAICSAYRDVIPAVECGMIGAYGEMHTSRYCDREYARRITSTWLDNLPDDMALLVRSPCYILYEAGAANTTEFFGRGLDASPRIRRIGFYNDGYLGTDGDYGTWGSGSASFTRAEGCAYLRPRGNVPYGGEFATVTDEYFEQNVHLLDPKRFNLVEEWYDTHLSYLRTIHATEMTVYRRLAATRFEDSTWAFDAMPYLAEYNGETLQKFGEDHMGFRFVVREVAARRNGRRVTLALKIENTGFGRLCFPETKEILVRDCGGAGGESGRAGSRDPTTGDDAGDGVNDGRRLGFALPLPATGTDLRLLEGGRTTAVEIAFTLPDSLPYGRYEVALRERVPLADEDGGETPRRVIAFANDGAFDVETKANYLCTMVIDGTADEESAQDVSSGGEALVVAGTTRDLSKTVFTSDARLVLAGGGTLILGESVPKTIEIENGRLEFGVFPDGFDFGSLIAHGNEVVIRNDAVTKTITLGDHTLDDYTLVGNFRYSVPAGRTVTLDAPAWIADFGVDVYGTLDVRDDLTLAGDVDVTIHAGGTMGNLGRSATDDAGRMIVRDRARIVVKQGGRLLNPVNGNWANSGLELMTDVEGATSLVMDGGTVAVHRMSGTGLGKIEVTDDSEWQVWYGEWYGNGRTPDPFKGASEVSLADGATLTVKRIKQSFGENQQDSGDITVNLADVHITGKGNLVFGNAHPTRKVEFVIRSLNDCTGEVSIVEDTGTSLVFLSGSSWAGGIVVTKGVTIPEDWWFAYNAAHDASSGGQWIADGVFEAEKGSDCQHDAIVSFTGVTGWVVKLPDDCGGKGGESGRAGSRDPTTGDDAGGRAGSRDPTTGASFLFLEEKGVLVPYGRMAEGWTKLGGKDFVEGVTYELEMDFKFRGGKWTVGFTVDGVKLVDVHGRMRFPVEYDPTALRQIIFDGPGRRGDFRGRLVRRPQGFWLEVK